MAKSIKSLRAEFKKDGIFYTPPELALKLKSYINFEPKTVYDPTCGAGNLLRVFPDETLKFGQEKDESELAKVDLPNFIGAAGDTLLDDKFPDEKFDCIVANPPFSIAYEEDRLQDDIRFKECGTLPPKSKADYAFILHILYHLADNGVAVVLEFPGILYRGAREGKIRQWLVEKNYIDRVVHVEGNTFEDTSIATCILVLRKNKSTTDITFEREGKTAVIPREEIADNSFQLSVQTYLPDEDKKEPINIDEVNRQVVEHTLKNVAEVVNSLSTLQKHFDDNFYIKELKEGLKAIINTTPD